MKRFARITTDSVKSPNYTNLKLDINRKYEEAFDELHRFSSEFIRRNEGSLVTLLALTNQIGPQFYVFHPANDMDIYIHTDSVLFARYPDNEPVKSLHNQLITFRNQYASSPEKTSYLSKGDIVPEVALPSPEGQTVKLSSTRGKYVLLDFWASWCPPCRQENPNLVRNYQKYHSKGFEIYQVSLDKDKNNWISAIRMTISTGSMSVILNTGIRMVVASLGLTSIPSNYLLDKNGKIIAVNLRGEELDQKLDEIFNH